MDKHECAAPTCNCVVADATNYCGTKCRDADRDQVEKLPEGPSLSPAPIDPPDCDCGHLDCEEAEPEPQI